MQNFNILIVGVGGQGTILASRIIGSVAAQVAKDVKISEIHGMSQRGGSVITQVRFGDKVYSPVIAEGTADVILAFEELEAFRWYPYLKKQGLMLMNNQEIDPMPVIMGIIPYPVNISEKMLEVEVVSVPALPLATQAGNSKAVNVVLMGVLAKRLGYEKSVWQEALKANVPAKFLTVNEEAFDLGYNLYE
ncbi:MAG: indolepyruvate oxidoreductase subunit beta [Clostridia bacterium]